MTNGDDYLQERRKIVSLNTIDKKLAVLCERMTTKASVQKSINNKLDVYIDKADTRLRTIENLLEITMVKQDDNKAEIDLLRTKSNFVDLILAIGTILAGMLGMNNK